MLDDPGPAIRGDLEAENERLRAEVGRARDRLSGTRLALADAEARASRYGRAIVRHLESTAMARDQFPELERIYAEIKANG